MFKKILLISTILFTANTYSAEYLDTQYGENGLEGHVLKVTIKKSIMTIIVSVENTGDEKAKYLSMPIKQVYFHTEDNKYPVIRDNEKKWLASPVAYSSVGNEMFANNLSFLPSYDFTLKAKAKKIGWLKFEAPKDSDWPLEFILPGFTPFTLSKPE